MITADVIGWSRGLYFVSLIVNGKEQGSVKIVVN